MPIDPSFIAVPETSQGFDPSLVTGPGDPKPSPKIRGFDPSMIAESQSDGQWGVGPGTGIDPTEYDFQLRQGANNDWLRAKDQSVLSQAGLAISNGVVNALTGIVKDVASYPIFNLFDGDGDYSNVITKAMDSIQNPFGEIYRTNPEATFDLGNSGWWAQQFSGLITAAAQYGLEGWAAGTLFSKLAMGAARSLGAESQAVRLGAKALGKTAASATIGYAMSASGAAEVYKYAYDYQRRKMLSEGASPEEADARARDIAASSAATSFKTAFLTNALLETAAIAPIFRQPKNEVMAFLRKEIEKNPSVSAGELRNILNEIENSPELARLIKNRPGMWSSRAMSSAQQSLVMLNLQHAHEEGVREAEHPDQERSLWQSLTDMDSWLKDVTNQEGLLSVLTGAAMGFGQSMLIDAIPSRYIARYDENNRPIPKKSAEGKLIPDPSSPVGYKTEVQLVTPKTYNEFHVRRQFDQVKDALMEDLNRLTDLRDKLLKAQAEGNKTEAERLRSQLFSIGALHSINRGWGDMLKGIYRKIMEVDNETPLSQKEGLNEQMKQAVQDGITMNLPADNIEQVQELAARKQQMDKTTEAMRMGLAKSPEDNEYKVRAQQAIEDIDNLTRLHRVITGKYTDPANPISYELADHIFAHRGDIYLREKVIEREQARLDREKADQADFLPDEAEASARVLNDYWDYEDRMEQVQKDLDRDLQILKKGTDEQKNDLIRRYQIEGFSHTEAEKELIEAITQRKEELSREVRDRRINIEEDSGYLKWKEKHPKGTKEQFINSIRRTNDLNMEQAAIDYLREEQKVATSRYRELTSREGIRRTMKALIEQEKKTKEDLEKRIKETSAEDFLARQQQRAIAQMNTEQKKAALSEVQGQIRELVNRRNEVVRKIQDTKVSKSVLPNALTKTGRKLSSLEKEKQEAEENIKELQNKENTLKESLQKAISREEEAEKEPAGQVSEPEETPSEVVDPSPQQSTPQKDNPADVLTDMVKSKTPLQQEKLNRIVEGLRSGETSKDNLLKLVKEAVGEDGEWGKIATAIRDYVDYLQVTPEEIEIPEEPELPSVSDSNDIPPIDDSDQPVITPPPVDGDNGGEEPDKISWRDDPKVRDIMKINSAHLEYKFARTEEGEGKERMFLTRDNNGKPVLSSTANTQTMIPGYLNRKDELILRIPENLQEVFHVVVDDRIENDEFLRPKTTARSVESYLKEGKIDLDNPESYGEIPIEIVNSRGERLGFLPRGNWTTATHGSENFSHVVDEYMDGDQLVTDNVLAQYERLMRTRKSLAEAWNKGDREGMSTEVSDITEGHLILSARTKDWASVKTGEIPSNLKAVYKNAKENIPTDETIVIVQKGELRTGFNRTFTGPLTRFASKVLTGLEGQVAVMLRSPSGKYEGVILDINPIVHEGSDYSVHFNTMARAIELYLRSRDRITTKDEGKMIARIRELTGFDITHIRGLRNFLEQYYTRVQNDFHEGYMKMDAPGIDTGQLDEEGNPIIIKPVKLVFKVKPGRDGIRAGLTYSGNPALTAKLVEGKLDPAFKDLLLQGLRGKPRQINFERTDLNREGTAKVTRIRGIGGEGEFTSISINASDDITAHNYKNYEEYVKDNATTNVTGQQVRDSRTGKDTWVYFANPQYHFSDPRLPEKPEAPGEIGEPQKPIDDGFDDISMDSINFNVRKVEPEGKPLTVENLKALQSRVPKGERADTTPVKEMIRMRNLGIDRIPEGYNPFRRC